MSERLAAMAEKHYQEFLPDAYAALDDPTTFFQILGEQAEEQIEVMAEALRGPDPEDEPFVDRMARFSVARQTAESEVIREMVLPAPPEPRPTNDEREADDELAAAMRGFREAVDEFWADDEEPSNE